MMSQESQKLWAPRTSQAVKNCVPEEFSCSTLPLALLLARGLCQGLWGAFRASWGGPRAWHGGCALDVRAARTVPGQ